MNETELRAKFPHASDSFIKANAVHSVAGEKPESNFGDELLATDAVQSDGQMRRLVRFTLFRCRLLDEDNPYLKPFVDALKEAGILVDDSPAWCRIECVQKIVDFQCQEGTLIEIEEL